MNGVLNIDKPAGMTSHDVVGRLRRLAHLKRVGHAGTLDPDATGVLLVCLGPATRIAEYLADAGKSYRATLALGRTTTTEDASGETLVEADASAVTEKLLRETLPRFMGDILQVPPMVSAVHHEGKRLYELARQGITVERDARPVRIDAIGLIGFSPGPSARATLDIDCGKGTYIRTLCADIGAALGVGGHMADLRRTKVGAFSLTDAVPLEQLTEESIATHITPPSVALADLPAYITTGPADEAAIGHGRALPTDFTAGTIARLVTPADQLLALGVSQDGLLRPFKVFV
jgi:tRNA pseudouridine55 synthase